LRLDNNFDVDVNINVNISIDIDDLSLPALPPPQPSYRRTFDPFSSQNAVLVSYPPPFRAPRAHILTRLQRLRKHWGRTKDIIRLVDQSMFPLKMDARQTGECAEKGEKGNVQAGRNTICRTIFELRRSRRRRRKRRRGERRRRRREVEKDYRTHVRSIGRMGWIQHMGSMGGHHGRKLGFHLDFAARRTADP
jgi:hypothetical protein